MSQQYDNTNKGVLFPNDRKKSDCHPDYTGSIDIEGVEHWLSAWVKEGKKGEFLSLSIGDVKNSNPGGGPRTLRKPEIQTTEASSDDAPKADDKQFEDDIPF